MHDSRLLTMKTSLVACTIVMLFASGCMLIDGRFYRTNLQVVLKKDQPDYFATDPQELLGGYLGTLPLLRGDSIATVGYFTGGMLNRAAYMMRLDGKEVFVLRSDVLTPDDLLYERLGPKFTLYVSEDELAWMRAEDYITAHSLAGVEVVNESLIKTKGTSDTLAISYLVTRVDQHDQYEYEIICESLRKDFEPYIEASALAFYMATGRKYVY